MQVRYHEKTGVFILHTHIITEGSEVIPQVQKAGRPDAAHYYFFLFFHKEDEDSKKLQEASFRPEAAGYKPADRFSNLLSKRREKPG